MGKKAIREGKRKELAHSGEFKVLSTTTTAFYHGKKWKRFSGEEYTCIPLALSTPYYVSGSHHTYTFELLSRGQKCVPEDLSGGFNFQMVIRREKS